MKTLKMAGVVFLLAALLAGSPAISYAYGGHDTKVLKDSAAALKTTHPDLSSRLTNLADQEAKGMKGDKQAVTQLLEDSAAALQNTNPKLATDLRMQANQESKHMKKKA